MVKETGEYQGETAEIVRPARQGDNGYKDEVANQVLVRFKDGSEVAVLRSELKNVKSV